MIIQQGIKNVDAEESSFDRRIKERIRLEEEQYEAKQKELANKSDQSDEDMDDFDKMATQQETEEAAELDLTAMAISDYQLGSYSPKLISQDDLPADTFIITQREDSKRMQLKRNQVLGSGSVKPDDEEVFEKNAREKIAIGE